MAAFAVLAVATAVATVLRDYEPSDVYRDIWPLIFPLGGVSAFAGVWLFLRRGEDLPALVCSGAMIALLVLSMSIGLFPNLIISTTDPANDLTIYNAAAADNTLAVCLAIALIGMPFVLLYTAGVYYIFRGKVRLSGDSY